MQRSRIATLALLFACHPSGFAAQRDTAIDKLLRPIVSNFVGDHNVGAWDWKMSGNGGYLLRSQMDVTGDGKPEIFIASTLSSSSAGHDWHVFDVPADGTLRPYQGTLRFDGAKPSTQDGITTLDLFPVGENELIRISSPKPYRVTKFHFKFPVISKTDVYVSSEEAIELQPPGNGLPPKLQAMLLADYLTDANREWEHVTGLGLKDEYYFVPEMKERAAKNTNFTPANAVAQLGSIQLSPPREKKHGSTIAPVGASRKPSDQTRLEEKEATSSKKPNSPTPWLVALMAAAIGLLGYWFKRSKTTGG